MLSIDFQARIFEDYHGGKDYTNGRKYRYSIQYNPIALVHIWIVRQPMQGGAWEWAQPLAMNLQFTPRNSAAHAGIGGDTL